MNCTVSIIFRITTTKILRVFLQKKLVKLTLIPLSSWEVGAPSPVSVVGDTALSASRYDSPVSPCVSKRVSTRVSTRSVQVYITNKPMYKEQKWKTWKFVCFLPLAISSCTVRGLHTTPMFFTLMSIPGLLPFRFSSIYLYSSGQFRRSVVTYLATRDIVT